MLVGIRARRAATTAVFGVALTGALSLNAGTSASASDAVIMARPTGCHQQIAGDTWTVARCDHDNGGAYRASATCKFPNGKIVDSDGPWKQTGWSHAYCPGDSKAIDAGIWTRVTN